MLNRVILMGRITQDLEIRQTQSGTSVLRFTVAVDRAPAKQGGERQTDFISCTAFGQRAEFIKRYFAKGRMIAIEGNLKTGNYEKDGVKHFTTDVWVESSSFTGEPKQQGQDNISSDSSPTPPAEAKANINIGALDDFEEVISDENAPF